MLCFPGSLLFFQSGIPLPFQCICPLPKRFHFISIVVPADVLRLPCPPLRLDPGILFLLDFRLRLCTGLFDRPLHLSGSHVRELVFGSKLVLRSLRQGEHFLQAGKLDAIELFVFPEALPNRHIPLGAALGHAEILRHPVSKLPMGDVLLRLRQNPAVLDQILCGIEKKHLPLLHIPFQYRRVICRPCHHFFHSILPPVHQCDKKYLTVNCCLLLC